MLGRTFSRGGSSSPSQLALFGRASTLLLPTLIMAVAAMRASGSTALVLWMGTAFQVIVCTLSFLTTRTWRQPISPSIITLYLIALCWLWYAEDQNDWYTYLAKALLLAVPVAIFAWQTLYDSGAPAIRRARLLTDRLQRRRDWPALAACAKLPEVKALRAALHIDASPALALLSDRRPQVRLAALAALEFRKEWRPGQPELILQHARECTDPLLRCAALAALANVDDRALVDHVAEFLRDPVAEVRHAAAEALLWDTERRWPWIRHHVRRLLADPLYQHDGALWHDGEPFTPEAIKDLNSWASEKGVLSVRASQTLAAHYSRALGEGADEALVPALRSQLAAVRTPAILRLEIARLLQTNQELDPATVDTLLLSSNPASLRLIAIETLLGHADDPRQKQAVGALRELARLPNREIALAAADLVQRRLGVDLGLAVGQPLPTVNSRQAAEITRRVMFWANQPEGDGPTQTTRGQGSGVRDVQVPTS
jgi:HEAT repeat protein